MVINITKVPVVNSLHNSHLPYVMMSIVTLFIPNVWTNVIQSVNNDEKIYVPSR